MKIYRSLSCALVLFAAAVGAPAAHAQAVTAQRAVTRAELLSAGGATLYEAIERIRPDWLALAGSTEVPVIVFVDGRHVGSLTALNTLRPEDVGSVRLRTPEYVRRTLPRFPRQEFAAALFVSTRTSAQQHAARGRTSIRLGGGLQMLSQARATGEAYDDAGFDQVPVDPDHRFTDQITEMPVTLGVGVHRALRDPWGVEAQVQYTLDGWMSGLNYARGIFNATLNSTEGAVLATYRAYPFRVGVGPGYRATRYKYHGGFSRNSAGTDYSSSGVGVVGALSIMLPATSRTFGDFTLRAAHYPTEKTPAFNSVPAVSTGTAVSASFGFGVQF